MGRAEWIERARLEKHIKALTVDGINIRTRLQGLLKQVHREISSGAEETGIISYTMTPTVHAELVALAGSHLPEPRP